MAERESQVTQALVELASTLANGYDVLELLTHLTSDCARLLDIASAGLLLADPLGVLHVMAASSEQTRLLEVFQLQRDEGPCRDCFHTAVPVLVPDLQAERGRWPQFVPAALNLGFASVHAVPLRLRDNTLGALGLFGASTGELNSSDLALAQALADVASVALVQDRIAADSATINEQLQEALNSRVVLEQAKGLLAQQGGLDMISAFAVLRRYSRDHNLRLTVVAEQVVARTLMAADLVRHARAAGIVLT